MLRLIAGLLHIIARQPGHGTAEGPLRAIHHARPEVVELAARLLGLALGVLLTAFVLQALVADEVAEALFAGADGLVPSNGRE